MTILDEVPTYLRPEVIQYELKRFGAELYFDPSVLKMVATERVAREHSAELALKVMGIVATWRQQRVLKVPANWWQHFKQRFFPKWALERWPVLYEFYDAEVILPRVPVVDARYHTVEFPVWSNHVPAKVKHP